MFIYFTSSENLGFYSFGTCFMKDFNIKKLYYSISEVSKITEVEQYVLRYWETEFEQLSPQKNRAGNRAYTNKDIQIILLIKKLLREQKYTIEGAKKIFNELYQAKLTETDLSKGKLFESDVQEVNKIPNDQKSTLREDLLEIKNLIESILKIL